MKDYRKKLVDIGRKEQLLIDLKQPGDINTSI